LQRSVPATFQILEPRYGDTVAESAAF
jgi:hypothetical protein